MSDPVSVASSSRLAVVYRPVNDLTPDPRNARTHPKRQIDQLRASIKEFGFTNPILIDPEGHIIAGHGRLQAARAIGIAEVPTIALAGLSEPQKRALRIADNKIALNAGWDLEILQCPPSGLLRQFRSFREGRISGSSQPIWSADETEIRAGESTGRAGREGHPPGNAPVVMISVAAL
ncbi:ParB-like nuclease [Nitrobacter winogradskyi Nb-255]|uniref:ParB-like nuclease n=1 Tax=Nitrobacter winogradskyi (strain ATCC 25391 / DSM 10237 / CIP 104748 / NCIMB 11846 / Nb-255) TaxID=323098 RepID=Q3SNF8_NITWN|nr:ParB-like nuclease [Nitrobacter winogradskyi Nb-255]